jgi:phytoene synthase
MSIEELRRPESASTRPFEVYYLAEVLPGPLPLPIPFATSRRASGTLHRAADPRATTTTDADAAVSANAADERLMASQGRTFRFAARFLPVPLRPQVIGLYAFFRTLDDLVDDTAANRPASDTAAVRAELAAWRAWLDDRAAHPAPRPALAARLGALLDAGRVPTPVLHAFLDGMEFDLCPPEIADFAALRQYCYRVAGTVGLAIAHLMDATTPATLAAAEQLGTAMQLTNVLRDVGGDLVAGRVYLPRDELARHGSSPAHLADLVARGGGPDDHFRALMREQIARARHYYARGMAGIWLLPRDCRLPILIAARLYRGILMAIERADYDVLRHRAATSLPEKLGEAAVAFTLDRLWRRGEAPPSAMPPGEAEEVLLGY